MQLKNSLHEINPFGKLMFLIATSVGFTLLIFILLFAVNGAFFNIPLDFANNLTTDSEPYLVLAAKIMQIASQFEMFILPALAFFYFSDASSSVIFKTTSIKPVIIVIATTLLAIPFINLLAEWNTFWHLPEFLKDIEIWMRETQKDSDNIITVFVAMNTPTDIFLNILMMAIIPAIGEELIFRGILQTQLSKIFKNAHWAIIISALLFSALYLQFLGFFSRAILGVIFGYMFYWSNNIWLPILAHFINNFLALVLIFVFGAESSENSFENPFDWTVILIAVSAFISSWIILITYRRFFSPSPIRSIT